METPEEHPAAVVRLLWSRVIWRHWRREKKLTAILVGILALGVAAFLAVHLANKAAVAGFGIFTDSVSGESDLLIRPKAGDLREGVLSEIREQSGSLPVGIFPVLEVSAADQAIGSRMMFQLVGVDLVAVQNAPEYTEGTDAPPFIDGGVEILGRSDRGFISETLARKRNLEAGDCLPIFVNDRAVDLEIIAILQDSPLRPGVPEEMILMDLPGLQELAGREGWISRIEMRVSPGSDYKRNLDGLSTILEERGTADYFVETPEARKESVTTMGSGFRLNLTILSSLALLVGTYLIMQAMEAAVIKRRSEIAILRALGVTPGQVRLAWILESVILGSIGSLLGVVLGWLLAGALVGGISQTVNTLYYRTTTDSITLSALEIGFSLSFGILSCVVAAFVPAREAANTPPALTMKSGSQKGGLAMLQNIPLGVTLLCGAILCALLPPYVTNRGVNVPVGGYVAALFFVLGFSILSGLLFSPLARILQKGKRNPLRQYAASQFRKTEGRHRLTAAGLAVAIGMSAAMGILVASFDTTLKSWIGHLLKADVYVSAPGSTSITNESTISKATWKAVEAMPEVEGLDVLRRYKLVIDGKEVFLGGSEYNQNSDRFLRLIWLREPENDGPLGLVEKTEGRFPAYVNESFFRKFGLTKGDQFSLPTPKGEKPIVISGVYADYGSETGVVIVSRKNTRIWFSDDSISQMAVYAGEGVDHSELSARIGQEHPSLNARTNARLRAESLRIFHQTFSVTYALEAIAVIIAVTGLGLALSGLLMERAAELETLKSLGATRRGIATAAAWEGAGLAIVGLSGGFLMSGALGWLLIYVINPQSFGWTLDYAIPWKSLAGLSVLTITAAAAVAYGVGFRYAQLRYDRVE